MVITDHKLFEEVEEALNAYSSNVMSSFDGSDVGFDMVAFVPNEDESKYSLLLSAYWLDDKEEFDVVDDLMPFLRQNLKSEVYKVKNIAVIHTSDPIVQLVTSRFKNLKEEVVLTDLSIGSNHINKLIIWKS